MWEYLNRTERNAEDILARYDRGERDVSLSEVPDEAPFRGSALSGAALDGSWIDQADFSGARLRGASLRGAHIKLCDLTDADLREAAIDAASFRNAVLTGVKLAGASAYGHVFADGDRLPEA